MEEHLKRGKQAKQKVGHLFPLWSNPRSVVAGLLGHLFALLIAVCNIQIGIGLNSKHMHLTSRATNLCCTRILDCGIPCPILYLISQVKTTRATNLCCTHIQDCGIPCPILYLISQVKTTRATNLCCTHILDCGIQADKLSPSACCTPCWSSPEHHLWWLWGCF